MKKETLFTVGGALLATTALSTAASAGTLKASGGATGLTTFAAPPLSAQVFPATGASSVTLGPQTIAFEFTTAITSAFFQRVLFAGAQLNVAGTQAALNVRYYRTSGTNSIASSLLASELSCTIQVLTDRLVFTNCSAAVTATFGGLTFQVNAMVISGLVYDTANGLATAGNSISVSSLVSNPTQTDTFDVVASSNLVTSINSASGSITGNASATLSATTTPTAFTALTAAQASQTGVLSFTIASVSLTNAGAVGTGLTTTLTASQVAGSMSVTITSAVLTDPAVTNIASTNTPSVANVTPLGVFGGVVTFTYGSGTYFGAPVIIAASFNGTTAIQAAAAGTGTAVFTASTSGNTTAPAAVSGTTNALSRGGFSAELNTLQSSFNPNANLYQSFIRITNKGVNAGVVTIKVYNDKTGALLGTVTTRSIDPNGTLQIPMASIEGAGTADVTGLNLTAATGAGLYQVELTGSINAYVQHVTFNPVSGFITDLSGFRNGGGGVAQTP